MTSLMRRVWVTHRFPALHSWPAAPAERAYLRAEHRHLFHVRLALDVLHEEREVEFHDLLDILAAECDWLIRHEQVGSCETIAAGLAGAVAARWPKRRVACEVSEDGENGAEVVLLP